MQAAYPNLTQFIAGEWRQGRGERTARVLNPADCEPLGELAHASPADVADAIFASARAFRSWRAVSPLERSRLLRDTAQLIRARREEIGRLITLELGKPIAEARREVDTAAEIFEWAAEEARRSYGRLIPSRTAGITQAAVLEPIGPVAAFAGWNAPAITPARKISGAVAAGCTIVLKASEETPAVALAIARAAEDAGIPAGVINLVFGDPAAIAQQLLTADAICMLSFTGAISVGKQLGELAARTMKRATLELGGHAPVLVFDDVDVARVARAAAAMKFRNAGQVCTSPTRFYVQKAVYQPFCDAFVQATLALKVGNPLDESTQMGPLKNERRRQSIGHLVDDALSHGATVLTGGTIHEGPGFFHAPTVLDNLTDACLAATQEPFGPLALMHPFEHFEDAVARANHLPFGLAAYAFTRDVHRAHSLAEALESGVVCINEWQASLPETPFGGVKDSGMGSEGGTEGLREFQRVKCIRMGHAS